MRRPLLSELRRRQAGVPIFAGRQAGRQAAANNSAAAEGMGFRAFYLTSCA